MTTGTDVSAIARELEAALPPLNTELRRLLRTTVCLLAEGRPVEVERLAAALDRPAPEVEARLAGLPWGIHRDESGRVVGAFGMGGIETAHRLRAAGREPFTWCAWDTLFLAIVLRWELGVEEVAVESHCPVSGVPIALTVSDAGVTSLAPERAVMSFLLPTDGISGDVIANFCAFVHFFASEEAARAWTAAHERTFAVSIDDAFELARFWAANVFGAGGPPPAGRTGLAARLAFATLRTGRPAGPEEIAGRAGLEPGVVTDALRRLAEAGEANLDEDGRVVAVAGLSLVPAAHELLLAGRPLFTWCAWDAVGIPAALEVDATVRTHCRWCGAPIAVELAGGHVVGRPPALLWLPTRPTGGDSRDNPQVAWCPHANLFCTRDHLDRWRESSGRPAGEAITVEEAAGRGATHWAAFAPPRHPTEV